MVPLQLLGIEALAIGLGLVGAVVIIAGVLSLIDSHLRTRAEKKTQAKQRVDDLEQS